MELYGQWRGVLFLWLLFGLVFVGVATATAVAGTGDAQPEEVALFDTPLEPNETPPHLHPDEIEAQQGDIEAVKWWYGWFVSGILQASAINTSDGQYALAREGLDLEYRAALWHYQDVANEIAAPHIHGTFDDARDRQLRFANDTEAFWLRYDAYHDAVDAGDEERVIELARDLANLARDINETGHALLDDYETIEDADYRDLSQAKQAIWEVLNAIEPVAAEATEAHLTETDLTLVIQDDHASFLAPIEATGWLQTADGEAIANEIIQVSVRDRQLVVQTNETGAFTFEHRPVTMPAGATQLEARYVPAAGTDHLGSADEATVFIEQVEPTITDLSIPGAARYADTIEVTATIQVDDITVDGVPIELFIGDEVFETVTAQRGDIAGSITIPIHLPPDEFTAGVRVAVEDRAIAQVSETDVLLIVGTPSNLSLNATVADEELSITGDLITDEGLALSDQSIELAVDGIPLGSTTTDGDGHYSVTRTIPDGLSDRNVTVRSVFHSPGPNIGSAEATDTVIIPVHLLDEDDEGGVVGVIGLIFDRIIGGVAAIGDALGLPPWAVWLALIVLLTASIAFITYRYGSTLRSELPSVSVGQWLIGIVPSTDRDTTSEDSEPIPTPMLDEISVDVDLVPDPELSYLERSKDALEAGRSDAAVVLAYAAVRDSLSTDGDDRYLTHVEFRDRYGGDGFNGALDSITRGFELVVYADRSITRETARGLIDEASEVCTAG